jgi:hypothetical protein
LLDAQDHIDRIERDELTGWTEAMVKLRKSFVDYELLSRELAARQPAMDTRTKSAYRTLARAVSGADLTTPIDQIEPLRVQLVAELVADRVAFLPAPSKERP